MAPVSELRPTTVTVLQRVVMDRPTDLRPLYWHHGPAIPTAPIAARAGFVADRGLSFDCGTVASFNSYFNSFFEPHWRLYTRVRAVSLRLRLDGHARLRVWRDLGGDNRVPLHEAVVAAGTHMIAIPPPGGNFRQAGRLHFELAGEGEGGTLIAAEWVTEQPASPVVLAAVFCTFDRVPHIAAVLRAIAGDDALLAAIGPVIVVNQGQPDLDRRPELAFPMAALGDRFHLFEQANFGGAGGFSRGILEACADPEVTHVALLDDDILLEQESLLRMIRIFAYAQPNVCIGGHMLDSIQRHRLYEAGAVVTNEHWALRPSHADRDLRQNEVLNALLDVPATDYNGWWMFGLPVAAVAEAGMPLPCFIRGDDVEFGLRLGGLGRLTVPFPGVAVWHEPFYLKIGGWHLYYETRNLLIAAVLHLEFSRGKLALILMKRVMQHLLTYRYYNAALVLRAIGDFMAGPAILRRDPLQIHAGLLSLRQDYPAAACRRELPLVAARPARAPRSALGQGWRMLRVLVFNTLPPVRVRAKPHLLAVHDLIWFRMLGLNHVAVDTYWDLELPVLRRSAPSFLKLATAATRSIARLSFSISRRRAAWREAMPELTSASHWRQYLGLADAAPSTAELARPSVTVCPPAA